MQWTPPTERLKQGLPFEVVETTRKGTTTEFTKRISETIARFNKRMKRFELDPLGKEMLYH